MTVLSANKINFHFLFCRYPAVPEDALVVEGLRKTFKDFVAVQNLNFGVHHGECFGKFGQFARFLVILQ
jgi:hypothetical protein